MAYMIMTSTWNCCAKCRWKKTTARQPMQQPHSVSVNWKESRTIYITGWGEPDLNFLLRKKCLPSTDATERTAYFGSCTKTTMNRMLMALRGDKKPMDDEYKMLRDELYVRERSNSYKSQFVAEMLATFEVNFLNNLHLHMASRMIRFLTQCEDEGRPKMEKKKAFKYVQKLLTDDDPSIHQIFKESFKSR
jgi:hypothetical protein